MNLRSFVMLSVLSLAAFASGCSSSEKKTSPPPPMKSSAPTPAEKADASAKAADSAASTAPGDKKVTCVNGGDTRVIEIEAIEGKGCEVIYTKNGNSKSVQKQAKAPSTASRLSRK